VKGGVGGRLCPIITHNETICVPENLSHALQTTSQHHNANRHLNGSCSGHLVAVSHPWNFIYLQTVPQSFQSYLRAQKSCLKNQTWVSIVFLSWCLNSVWIYVATILINKMDFNSCIHIIDSPRPKTYNIAYMYDYPLAISLSSLGLYFIFRCIQLF